MTGCCSYGNRTLGFYKTRGISSLASQQGLSFELVVWLFNDAGSAHAARLMSGGLESCARKRSCRVLLNFCLSNFVHLHEMPFVSEHGAVEGMFVASQLNARERLG